MIEELMQTLEHEKNSTLELTVYSSLSPNLKCCDALKDFVAWLFYKNIRLNAILKFSNFDGIFGTGTKQRFPLQGYLEILSAYYTFKTFDGQFDWEEFFNRIEVVPEEKMKCMASALSTDRKEREKEDLSFLSKIENKMDYRGMNNCQR